MRFRGKSISAGSPGFTLIELLVSIVILSTGIVLVLEVFQTAMVRLGESRDVLTQDMLARERLALVDLQLAESPTTPPQSTAGRFSGRFKSFDWSQRVVTAPQSTSGSDAGRVYEISIIVGRVGEESGYPLRSARFVPAEKEE
jgi:prepilin-type N-terminal cleavage/methylation domain-containing protein